MKTSKIEEGTTAGRRLLRVGRPGTILAAAAVWGFVTLLAAPGLVAPAAAQTQEELLREAAKLFEALGDRQGAQNLNESADRMQSLTPMVSPPPRNAEPHPQGLPSGPGSSISGPSSGGGRSGPPRAGSAR